MSIYKFNEVLNDTINYFLLVDILNLNNYKIQNNLSNYLANELTTNKSGDEIIEKGILIPMYGIENYPYTIIFNLSNEIPELLKEENQLQIRQNGYILKIESGNLMLFTWWILNDFTEEKINKLLELYKQHNKPLIEIEKGWYEVEILGGLTITDEKELEPTFEFIIKQTNKPADFKADASKLYYLKK